MKNSIQKFEIGSSVLSRYADLDYDIWYALAEFVDNSLHSYLNNQEALNRLNVNICEVAISLTDNNGNDSIIINDNAAGIHPDEFERLLSLGIKKEKAKHQLSEFGMGMKTAAIWLSNQIEIETKHYLLEDAYSIKIDLSEVTSEDYIRIEKVRPSSNKSSYTKVKMTSLNRSLKRKTTIDKIRISLSNIYRKFIENKQLSIAFENELLTPLSFELMKDEIGDEIKKKFLITLENGKTCEGWVGVLAVESRSGKLSGFNIYRNSRLIQGYPETAWRPKEVFGADGGSNTLVMQRLVGELDMSQFKVSHTKNKILFEDDEEDELRKKLGELSSDIKKEAASHRSTQTDTKDINSSIMQQTATSVIKEIISRPIVTDDLDSLKIVAPITIEKSKSLIDKIVEEEEVILDFSHFKSIRGLEKGVLVYNFMDNNSPYMVVGEKDDLAIVALNVKHPFYQNLFDSGTAEQLVNYQLLCVFDALAELHTARTFGEIAPNEWRISKDLFLRNWMQAILED